MQRAVLVVSMVCVAVPSGCGSSSYAVRRSDFDSVTRRGNPQGAVLTAIAEPGGASVRVAARRMRLRSTEAIDDQHVRIRVQRPLGLLVTGSILLGLGAALMAGGFAMIPCPTGYICEQGLAVGLMLGLGAPHVLVGGIMDAIAGARWSPEVSR